MSVDGYDELKRELFEKFREIETVVKSAEHSDAGVPAPASNEVRYAGFHYIKADKESSEENEESAVEEMQRAVRHARKALFNMQRFRFLFYSRNVHSVLAELRGNEDLAAKYIPNYNIHKKNLSEVRKFGEDAKSYDENSPEFNATIYDGEIQKLRKFLNDFEEGKMALFAAMDKRSVLRGKTVRVLMALIAVFLGAIIGALFTIVRAG